VRRSMPVSGWPESAGGGAFPHRVLTLGWPARSRPMPDPKPGSLEAASSALGPSLPLAPFVELGSADSLPSSSARSARCATEKLCGEGEGSPRDMETDRMGQAVIGPLPDLSSGGASTAPRPTRTQRDHDRRGICPCGCAEILGFAPMSIDEVIALAQVGLAVEGEIVEPAQHADPVADFRCLPRPQVRRVPSRPRRAGIASAKLL
jgi:hypothetical protein